MVASCEALLYGGSSLAGLRRALLSLERSVACCRLLRHTAAPEWSSGGGAGTEPFMVVRLVSPTQTCWEPLGSASLPDSRVCFRSRLRGSPESTLVGACLQVRAEGEASYGCAQSCASAAPGFVVWFSLGGLGAIWYRVRLVVRSGLPCGGGGGVGCLRRRRCELVSRCRLGGCLLLRWPCWVSSGRGLLLRLRCMRCVPSPWLWGLGAGLLGPGLWRCAWGA